MRIQYLHEFFEMRLGMPLLATKRTSSRQRSLPWEILYQWRSESENHQCLVDFQLLDTEESNTPQKVSVGRNTSAWNPAAWVILIPFKWNSTRRGFTFDFGDFLIIKVIRANVSIHRATEIKVFDFSRNGRCRWRSSHWLQGAMPLCSEAAGSLQKASKSPMLGEVSTFWYNTNG